MVSAYSCWAGGNQETPSPDRSLTRRSPTSALQPLRPPWPPQWQRCDAAKSTSTPLCATRFLDMLDQWKTETAMGHAAVLVRGLVRGSTGTLRTAGHGSRHEQHRSARKILLSPADMTRLSERIMRVTDALCLSSVTIRDLVREWLDAEGLDVRPSRTWVKRLLRGVRSSYKNPADCVK